MVGPAGMTGVAEGADEGDAVATGAVEGDTDGDADTALGVDVGV